MAKYRKTTLTEISEPWRTGDGDGDFSCVRAWRYRNGTAGDDTGSHDACEKCGRLLHVHGWVDTLEGGHIVCPGDRICTGAKAEKYPIKPDIFDATYELVEE